MRKGRSFAARLTADLTALALAAGLAAQYISPAAALPGAVFSIWHNLSGAVLAMAYRRSDGRRAAQE